MVQPDHRSAAERWAPVHAKGATNVAVMPHSMMTDGLSNRSPAQGSAAQTACVLLSVGMATRLYNFSSAQPGVCLKSLHCTASRILRITASLEH